MNGSKSKKINLWVGSPSAVIIIGIILILVSQLKSFDENDKQDKNTRDGLLIIGICALMFGVGLLGGLLFCNKSK